MLSTDNKSFQLSCWCYMKGNNIVKRKSKPGIIQWLQLLYYLFFKKLFVFDFASKIH